MAMQNLHPASKFISLFLGILMLSFGFLKFIDPFKTWYTVQVTNSELGNISYWLGIFGEIIVGIVLTGSVMLNQKISPYLIKKLIGISSAAVVIMMITGIYVHLHPAVPSDVLPLKIKPPYIPGFFLLLAAFNIYKSFQYIEVTPAHDY
jgi:hypothetical protein